MSNARRTREWPLAIFTVALQCACGLAMASAYAEWNGSDPEMRPLGMAVSPVVVVGVLASLSHVGRPLSASRSLTNVARSRLSQEIWFTGTFAVAALVYASLWFGEGGGLRRGMGGVTALLGILAVAASARLYAIPARPFWRAVWMPLSFAGSTLLLGGLGGALVARPSLLWGYAAVAGAGAVVLLSSALLMMVGWLWLGQRDSAGPVLEVWPPVRPARWRWVAFALYLLLAGAAPLLFAVLVMWEIQVSLPAATAVFVFAVALAGVALGRALMFCLPESLAKF